MSTGTYGARAPPSAGPRRGGIQVKNRAPAQIQITAEQLLAEAKAGASGRFVYGNWD